MKYTSTLEQQAQNLGADLLENPRLLYSIIHNLPDMVFIKDAKELRFVLLNQAGERLLGYQASQLIGKNDYNFFPKEQADFFIAKDRAVLESGTLVDIEQEPIQTVYGEKILHTKKIPLYDDAGNPLYLLGISEDVTERYKLQRQLLEANENLEKNVKERTSQLRDVVVELEHKNSELNDFAYIVSHDLRAPLRALSNVSSWLVEDYGNSVPEACLKDLELMKTKVSFMQRLLDDLLGYSRVGRMEESNSKVNLKKLLDDIISNYTIVRNLKFIIQEDLPQIHTRRISLETILRNLVDNAVKHNNKEDKLVKIHFQELEASYVFKVEDNGPGIDPKFHEKIFKIYHSLNNNNQSDSTGVGLAIVRKVVDYHGGYIKVESEAGKGSVFILTWPKRI